MDVDKLILRSTKFVAVCLVILVSVQASNGINLGLVAGDLKRHTSPLFVKKISRHCPLFINIHSRSPLVPLPSLSLPKLPPKASSKKFLKPHPKKHSKTLSKLPKPPKIFPKLPKRTSGFSSLSPKLPLLPTIIIPPLIPKLPFLPLLLLPLLPPIIPPLPILPIKFKPHLPTLGSSLTSLKLQMLGKKTLQKALGSDLMPIIVPPPERGRKENVLTKLLELKDRGSLTTAEFTRFKKLLL